MRASRGSCRSGRRSAQTIQADPVQRRRHLRRPIPGTARCRLSLRKPASFRCSASCVNRYSIAYGDASGRWRITPTVASVMVGRHERDERDRQSACRTSITDCVAKVAVVERGDRSSSRASRLSSQPSEMSRSAGRGRHVARRDHLDRQRVACRRGAARSAGASGSNLSGRTGRARYASSPSFISVSPASRYSGSAFARIW